MGAARLLLGPLLVVSLAVPVLSIPASANVSAKPCRTAGEIPPLPTAAPSSRGPRCEPGADIGPDEAEGRWAGTFETRTAASVPGNDCSSTWEGKLTVRVRANGQVTKGNSTANATVPPTCSLGIAGVPAASSAELNVTGILTGTEFRLRFQGVAIDGFDGGFHLMYYPGPPRLRFPLVKNNLASGSFTLFNDGPEELAGGGGTASLAGILSLAKRKR